MNLFISWSGERSRAVAIALKSWLSDITPDVQTWMSDHDIKAGTRWNSVLTSELDSSSFGILCLTPENLYAPWILFEAGSLAKIVEVARVVPYRLGLNATDITFPLAQFQGVDADEQGTYKLLASINDARDARLPESRLTRAFEKWWPDLKQELALIAATHISSKVQRSDRDLLEELLQLVRSLNRIAPPKEPLPVDHKSDKKIQDLTEEEIYALTETDISTMNGNEINYYLIQILHRYKEAREEDDERALIERIRIAESKLG